MFNLTLTNAPYTRVYIIKNKINRDLTYHRMAEELIYI